MKIILFVAALLISEILVSQDGPSQLLGPNGGIVRKAGDYYIEVKNFPEMNFYAYLLDKELKNIGNKALTCNAEFFFPDSTSLEVKLRHASEGIFMADLASGYDACEITFDVFGTPVFARFKNISSIAHKKNINN